MTLCAFGANAGQKKKKAKNGSNSGFVLMGVWKVKSIGSTSIANFLHWIA